MVIGRLYALCKALLNIPWTLLGCHGFRFRAYLGLGRHGARKRISHEAQHGRSAACHVFGKGIVAETIATCLELPGVVQLRRLTSKMQFFLSKAFIIQQLARCPVTETIHDLIASYADETATFEARQGLLAKFAAKLVRNQDARFEVSNGICTLGAIVRVSRMTDEESRLRIQVRVRRRTKRSEQLLLTWLHFTGDRDDATMYFDLDRPYQVRDSLRTRLIQLYSLHDSIEGMCNTDFLHDAGKQFRRFRERNRQMLGRGFTEYFREFVLRVRADGRPLTQLKGWEVVSPEQLELTNDQPPEEQAAWLIQLIRQRNHTGDDVNGLLVDYSRFAPCDSRLQDDSALCFYLNRLEQQLCIRPLFGCMELQDLLLCQDEVDRLREDVVASRRSTQPIPTFADIFLAASRGETYDSQDVSRSS
eukprot:TRINITY_DN58048_c0_g2_i1.p1 TRINITY_DN58048_c0_g2~~TRINITY_DN58048_c0_g2_i1.p1  ORF type:complete len:419 (+),score=25.96 TRINITY_DN58048_c0_g2_i1:1523-2779(+)